MKEAKKQDQKKYTLITGASSGIGKAMAEQCAYLNQNLLLIALPDTGLPQIAKILEETYKVNVLLIEVDLTKSSSSTFIFDYCVKNSVRINILINNAAIGGESFFINTSREAIMDMMRLNMLTVVELTKLFVEDMKDERCGYILNVGSIAGFHPVPLKAIFSATKSFIYSFSKALKAELRLYNIHVSCLCPGPTDTSIELIEKHKKMGWRVGLFVTTSEVVAKKGLAKLFKKKGLIIPSWRHKLLNNIAAFTPSFLTQKIAEKTFKITEKNAPTT
jgi:uncharacterized protein